MLENSRGLGSSFVALLFPESFFDVWSDTTLGELGGSEQLVELLIVADCKLDVSWSDLLLLVLISALTRQIEDLHGEVLKSGCQEDSTAWSNSSGVSALSELSVAAANWEDESGLC